MSTAIHQLEGGFATPAVQSATAFRALLEAMARPGRIWPLHGATAPAPLSQAAAVTLRTLCDATTPLHLAGRFDTPEIRAWLAFHTGAPLVGPEAAQFALGDWAALQPVSRFAIGDPAYPDRAATLIVEMEVLANDTGARLTGPGIEHEARLTLPETDAFQANRQLFPLGFDTILTCGDQVAALPRSTEVEAN